MVGAVRDRVPGGDFVTMHSTTRKESDEAGWLTMPAHGGTLDARPKFFFCGWCAGAETFLLAPYSHIFFGALTLTREKHLDSFLRRVLALLPNPNPRSTPPFPPGVRPPVALAAGLARNCIPTKYLGQMPARSPDHASACSPRWWLSLAGIVPHRLLSFAKVQWCSSMTGITFH